MTRGMPQLDDAHILLVDDHVHLVENLTEINRGRAFFASLGDLEGIVFKDFLQNRQRRVR